MRTRAGALVVAASSVAACSGTTGGSTAAPIVAETEPQGRWRQDDFGCAVGDVESISIRVEMPACAPPIIDLPPPSDGRVGIERDPPRYPPVQRASCGLASAVACATAFRGDLDAHLLLCRNAAGLVDGPVELIGSDGSLLEQIFCTAGNPVGPRVVWRHGQIFSVSAIDLARQGVRVDDGRYSYPGQPTREER